MRESNPHERRAGPPSSVERTGCWSRRRGSNPHVEAHETSKVTVPSLRKTHGPAHRQAPPGEDNGTRTRTSALTTRRLALRPCPPQEGPFGWTRTTTSRVKSPVCCVYTTKGLRIWFGLRVSNPSLRAGNAECIPPHPGRTWTGIAHRPIDFRQLSKIPLREHVHFRDVIHRGYVKSRSPSADGVSPCSGAGHSARSRQNKKGLLGGRPRRPGFSMNTGPLGRNVLRIGRAAVLAIDPRLTHGFAEADDASLGTGQMKWPPERWARRVGEHSSHFKPRTSMYEDAYRLSIAILN